MSSVTRTITHGNNDATYSTTGGTGGWATGHDYLYTGVHDSTSFFTVMMFTPNLPAGVNLIDAKLRLYTTSTIASPAWNMGLLPIYSGDVTALLGSEPPAPVLSTPGSCASIAPGWVEFDITPAMQRFISDGHSGTERITLEIESSMSPYLRFYAYEGDPSLAPRITVQYLGVKTASSIAISRTSIASLSLMGNKAIVL